MSYDRNDYGRGAYGRDGHSPYGGRYGYTPDADSGRPNANRFDQDRTRDANRFGADRDRYRNGYGDDDRGFFDRAGDEVRSWFGDEDAERRRERDRLEDERNYRRGGTGYGDYRSSARQPAHDPSYHNWRQRQIDALDRDYDEYRRENQSTFDNQFHGWRTQRQTQRSSLEKVHEHMEVVGSDGEHIGTVDKVRGDRIILTKNDAEAGGHHHSIPSGWIESVDDKVKIRKSSVEAKTAWRDEERNGALFGDRPADEARRGEGPHILNRSFSGTY